VYSIGLETSVFNMNILLYFDGAFDVHDATFL